MSKAKLKQKIFAFLTCFNLQFFQSRNAVSFLFPFFLGFSVDEIFPIPFYGRKTDMSLKALIVPTLLRGGGTIYSTGFFLFREFSPLDIFIVES